MRLARPRPLLAAALISGLTAFTVLEQGCSFVTNETAVQCTSEKECLNLGPEFASTTCDPATKTCKKIESPLECNTNAECGAKDPGSICRKRDHKCVQTKSNECFRVIGKPEFLLDDNVILIGAITPARSGELGDVQELMVELAQSQFSPDSTGGGIPTASGQSRPLVVVSCLEFNPSGLQGLLNAANHLVKDLDVPIVIGPVDASDAKLVATSVTLPNKVLNIVPGGSFVSSLGSLPNPIESPLLWRLNFSDSQIIDTLQPFITNELVPRLKAEGSLKDGEDLRIAIIQEGDYKGQEVATIVKNKLTWNTNAQGAPASCADNSQKTPTACIVRDFGNLNDTVGNPTPEGKIASALGGVFNPANAPPGPEHIQPHIVLHSYATFGIPRIVFPIEAAWDTPGGPAEGKPRPYHIGLFPPFNTFAPLFGFMDNWSKAELASGDIPFNKRMFGLYPRTGLESEEGLQRISTFRLEFFTKFPDFPVSNTPTDPLPRLYYDAVYMAGYALAALNDKPISGENLARTLPRLVAKDGTSIRVGSADIQRAFATLARPDQNLNLDGISGNLNLDPNTASAKYSLEISCPGEIKDNAGNGTGKSTNFTGSGYYYDQETGSPPPVGRFFTDATCPFLKK